MAHPNTRPISFTYAPMASMWVITLHSLFLYSDPPLPCHPPSYWFTLFSSQTFSRVNTPTFSNLVTLHTYPHKMEQTESFEMSAYKIQMPGNYPEESTQHWEHGESLKSRKKSHCLVLIKERFYHRTEGKQYWMGSATDFSILRCFQHGMTRCSFGITYLKVSCWMWSSYCY
jgi:hypothetical protein